jgi:hypothetical protein
VKKHAYENKDALNVRQCNAYKKTLQSWQNRKLLLRECVDWIDIRLKRRNKEKDMQRIQDLINKLLAARNVAHDLWFYDESPDEEEVEKLFKLFRLVDDAYHRASHLSARRTWEATEQDPTERLE